MEASAEMKWGLICSVEDQEIMKEFVDFSVWMIKQLEKSASTLKLGHRFVETPTFVLHAVPGSIDQSRECYETIANKHPQVIYVIHILPSKDSIEYQLLKEHTLAGALVGQGVLAENALAYFKCYELDEVMANMNQWIGRRLAQITARRTEKEEKEAENNKICLNEEEEEKSNNWVKENNQKIQNFFADNICGQNQRNYQNNNNFNFKQKYNNNRKDNYRLTVATGANAIITTQHKKNCSSPTRRYCRSPQNNCSNNFEYPVDVVFNSSSIQCNRFGNINCPQPNTKPLYRQNNFNSNEVGMERDKEVIVKGFPPNFNKFQIASLFSDFRPLNVQHKEGCEAIVQFANKFQAVQIIELYNGKKYEDEGFILNIRTASNEDLIKQVGLVKTKLARLLLMSTTEKVVGKENVITQSDEDKAGW